MTLKCHQQIIRRALQYRARLSQFLGAVPIYEIFFNCRNFFRRPILKVIMKSRTTDTFASVCAANKAEVVGWVRIFAGFKQHCGVETKICGSCCGSNI